MWPSIKTWATPTDTKRIHSPTHTYQLVDGLCEGVKEDLDVRRIGKWRQAVSVLSGILLLDAQLTACRYPLPNSSILWSGSEEPVPKNIPFLSVC